MGFLDRFGIFGGDGTGGTAGEWAAKAMACMAFADGKGPGEGELAAVQVQVKTNRVLSDDKAAEAIFHQTVEAIRALPSVMLQTHEAEVDQLAQHITDPTEKNFALATVIAVAMGDGTVTPAEQRMLLRFKAMLGATIAVPGVGQTVHAFEAQAIVTGAVQPTRTEHQAAVNCGSCNKPTQFFKGHGHWCADCQQYAPAPATQPAQRERQETPEMPLPAVDKE
jgi:tellurite resistance protein